MGRKPKGYVNETPNEGTEIEIEKEVNLPAVTENHAIEEMTRAEIDTQISTAKKYPRSIKRFRQEALSMATADIQIAQQCYYVLPRKDKDGTIKKIEGASVRLAEIMASAYGNIRFGARIVDENEKEVIAQGVAHDLEKNIASTIEVSRRIVNKNGFRYGDDMVQVTKNAACSIALRNAILKIIPKVYTQLVYEQAKRVAVGTAKTVKTRLTDMLAKFAEMKITPEMLLSYIGKPSIEDIGLTEIETLIGVYTAIKDGDTTVKEQFKTRDKSDVSMPKEKGNPATDNLWEGEPPK